jgi:hypothetical protein
MGAPEIARHAAALAGRIATQLVRHQAGKGPLE